MSDNNKHLDSAAQDLMYVQNVMNQLSGQKNDAKGAGFFSNSQNFFCIVTALVGICIGFVGVFSNREANAYNAQRMQDMQRQLDKLESKTLEEAREIRGKIDLHDAYFKTLKN